MRPTMRIICVNYILIISDSIAIFGEASGGSALKYMHEKMIASEEGRSILQDKPRINSKTIDLNFLKTLPLGTLGHAYITFLDDNVS